MDQKPVNNLKQFLSRTARRYGDKAALVMGERRVSYREIEKTSNKFAHALLKLGINRGDRIAVLLPNIPEFPSIYFGIVKTGAIAVPMEAKHKPDELACFFDNSRPCMVIGQIHTLKGIKPFLARLDSVEMLLEVGGTETTLNYDAIIKNEPDTPLTYEPAPTDTAHIAYASGPTTRPTGVIVPHEKMIKSAVVTGEWFHQTENDVVALYALPLYHAFALIVVMLTSFQAGSTIIMVPGTGVSIKSLLEDIEKEKITILHGVPYIYGLLNKVSAEEGVQNDLSSLRFCGSGGAPLHKSIVQNFRRYYSHTIVDFWGLTEAMAMVTCPPLDAVKAGSVGKPLPGYELKIVDDKGTELPVGKVGEVTVRGLISEGYYNNPGDTARKFRDGWLYTGDMGRMDKDGYLFLTGLKKRMIILKGKKIYPSDIEEVLALYPKIAAVRVVGIPDRLRGEMVAAVVLLRDSVEASAQEIRRFCQEHMADYKTPREVFFATSSALSNLSKLAGTKISQRKLKAHLSSKLPHLPGHLKYRRKTS